MRVLNSKIALTLLGAVGLTTGPANAGVVDVDFSTDPIAAGTFKFVSTLTYPWRATGGNPGGYLAVTDAQGGSSSHIAFGELDDPNLVTAAFKFSCDLRIGGGTARPADGFSLNIVAADDPLVTSIESGGGATGYAGTTNENNLPEEGAAHGLGIGFDTWTSADVVTGVPDMVGISVRVNGELVGQFPVPLQPGNFSDAGGNGGNSDEVPYRNLATDDANYNLSMQTGALSSKDLNQDGVVDGGDAGTRQPDFDPDFPDPFWGDWIENLTWEEFYAEITQEGRLIIKWKGVELTPDGGLNVSQKYVPIKGARVVFGGRTGGAWEAHHVDNIHLETEAAQNVVIGAVTGTPIGFQIVATDSGHTSDPNSVVLTFDGNPVTPTSVDKANGVLTVRYGDPTNPMASGSTHDVGLTITQDDAKEISAVKQFTVPDYLNLPPEFAVAGANTPGFAIDVYHVDTATGNSVRRAEQQLHGDLGPNVAVDPFYNPIDSFTETGVINYSQPQDDFITPEQNGNWTDANGHPDTVIPGTPSNTTFTDNNEWRDNLALRIKTVLHFPKQGIYTLNFNSDDGYRTIAYSNNREQLNSLIIRQEDRGKGASDSTQTLYVAEPGYYPVSSVWFEGGGGASLEWSAETMDSNGAQPLINSSDPGALKAFQVATGDLPSGVVFTDPVRESGNPYSLLAPITIELGSGSSPVNAGSVKLLINDQEVNANVSGNSVTYTPPSPYPSDSDVKVGVEFDEQDGDHYSGSYTFHVETYGVLPPSLAIPQDALGPRGFLVRTVQWGSSRGNTVAEANTQLANYDGTPNIADMADFDADGWYRETDTINYEQNSGDAGNFNPSRKTPGIPGGSNDPKDNTDNFSLEILTVLHFPQSGLFKLGFNSDDGFAITAGDPRDRLTAPLLGIADVGKGASDVDFIVKVDEPGYYPIRIVYFEGGGGASCEFSSVTPIDGAGTRTLINDTGGIEAYQPKLDADAMPIVSPYVRAYGPGGGNNAPLTGTANLWLEDGAGTAGPVTMTYDGAEVTPTVTKNGTTTLVSYTPPSLLGEDQTVDVTAQVATDRPPLTWSFTTETGDAPTGDVAFFIEAEDFNSNGAAQPAASDMPYLGGAYAGLGATAPGDYNRADNGSSQLYRMGEDPQVPMNQNSDLDRGMVEVAVSYKLGWIDGGETFAYTRDFPTGDYNVWAGLSHGDGPDSGTLVGGSLQLLDGGPTELGTFSAPGTGGWGNNDLVPLKDADGNLVQVSLGGTQTLQFTTSNGDYDFLLFTEPGAPVEDLMFTSIVNNGDGTITVEWTGGGTLQAAPTVTGPWEDVPDAVSPYTLPIDPDAKATFGRLVK